MTKEQRRKIVAEAYTTMKKGDNTIHILDTEKVTDMATQNAIMDIQRELNTSFEISYEIMADACDIIAEYKMEGVAGDNWLKNDSDMACDFFADADSCANVYTAVQLSYLDNNNEGEISALMADEAITSIAQACSIWYSQKVAEACEALKSYIMQ